MAKVTNQSTLWDLPEAPTDSPCHFHNTATPCFIAYQILAQLLKKNKDKEREMNSHNLDHQAWYKKKHEKLKALEKEKSDLQQNLEVDKDKIQILEEQITKIQNRIAQAENDRVKQKEKIQSKKEFYRMCFDDFFNNRITPERRKLLNEHPYIKEILDVIETPAEFSERGQKAIEDMENPSHASKQPLDE